MVQKWHFIYLFDIFVPMMDSKRYWILALVILLRPLITTSFTRGLRNHGSCFHLAHLPHRMPTCKEQLVFDNNFIENDVPTARLEALPRLLNDDMRVNRSSLMPPSTDDTMKVSHTVALLYFNSYMHTYKMILFLSPYRFSFWGLLHVCQG